MIVVAGFQIGNGYTFIAVHNDLNRCAIAGNRYINDTHNRFKIFFIRQQFQ